jgi:NADH:ubiquinone reductase (H+-translocating)
MTVMPDRAKVVIVGAGFGGLRAARVMAGSQTEVLVIDRNNYHTFFPLLYQVAAAELEPEDIIYPVRSIFRGKQHLDLHIDEVTGVDLEKRLVKTMNHVFPYDYLVLAPGSTAHFFGVEGASKYAFQLKTLEDAIALRNHILFRFERALLETEQEKRKQMLTFAVIGGGPTGVEFTGALAELIRGPLSKDYPALDFKEVRLLLLEAADHLLPGLPERLQVYALKRLQKMGVTVRLGAGVTRITPGDLTLKDGTVIALETAIWTAGVRGALPAQTVALPFLHNGQVQVLPTLQVPGHPEIYVVGDLARIDEEGQPMGMMATVAIQEGEMAARNILRQIIGRAPAAFHYQDLGTLAVIGRNAAAVHLLRRDFTGFFAWLLWLSVHIYRLIGFRNRLLVLIDWAWDYLFFERGVRLIMPAPEEQWLENRANS